MTTIDSNKILTTVKAFSRSEKLPLDASEIHDSLEQAQAYIQSPKAYAGQTIKVLQNGKYETYVLNPSGDNLVLEKVGLDTSAVKNYVQVVENLPQAGQEQGVIYIQGTTGSIWNGTSFQTIFTDLQPLTNRVEALETNVYTKTETDNKITEAIGKITTLKRSVVDSLESVESPDENTIYMVAKAAGSGNQNYDEYMYINNKFEKIGDTEVDLTDYAKTADVDTKISTAKTEAITAAGAAADEKISAKLGTDWPEGKTVKEFVTESTNDILSNEKITNLEAKVDKNSTDITNLQNTKLDADAVDEKINTKVGEIPENKTVKDFIGDIGNSSTVADYVKAQVVSGAVTDEQLKAAVKAVTGDPGTDEDGKEITVVQYIDKALTITEF